MSVDLDDGDDQAILGRALHAARAGEDKVLAQQVREVGEQAVRLLTGLWRLMRSHASDNHAFDAPVRDFTVVLARLIDLLGPVHVVCVEGQVYVNDVRIRMDEKLGGAADLQEELAKHQSGGLHFEAVLPERDVRELLRVLASKPADRSALRALARHLRDSGLHNIRVSGVYRVRIAGESALTPDAEMDVPGLLHRVAVEADGAFRQARAGRALNPLLVRRFVNELVDATVAASAQVQAALLGAPDHSQASARHAVRVTALSVLIGAGIGLSRGPLADLGVCALFHDIGNALRGTGVAAHGSAGARILLRQRGFHAVKVKRLLVTLSHHRGLFNGPALYSRVVCIAGDYDMLTHPRTGGAIFNPAHALERLHGSAGERYDPALLQILVNRLGKYPPGSILRLKDGRWVVSTSVVREPSSFAAPLCQIVRAAPGVAGREGDPVDLAEEGDVVEVVSSADGLAWLAQNATFQNAT